MGFQNEMLRIKRIKRKKASSIALPMRKKGAKRAQEGYGKKQGGASCGLNTQCKYLIKGLIRFLRLIRKFSKNIRKKIWKFSGSKSEHRGLKNINGLSVAPMMVRFIFQQVCMAAK